MPRPISEKEFRAQMRQFARMMGWKCYHTHDSRKSDEGFPDDVLVRDRTLYVEAKSQAGELSHDQAKWINALRKAGEFAVCWRPSDWSEIQAVLTAPCHYPEPGGPMVPVPEKKKKPARKKSFL